MDDDSEPDLRHRRLPGARDRGDGPDRPLRPLHGGRTLAVLCTDFRGFQTTYEYTLPAAGRQCRCTRRSTRCTASSCAPPRRIRRPFPIRRRDGRSARRRAARGRRRADRKAGHRTERTLTRELRGALDAPDWRTLPLRSCDLDDPAAAFLATLSEPTDPDELIDALDQAPEQSVEVSSPARAGPSSTPAARRRRRRGRSSESAAATARTGGSAWYRGCSRHGARPTRRPRSTSSTSIYHALPGELAPKLALGGRGGVEADELDTAAHWYDDRRAHRSGFPRPRSGLHAAGRGSDDLAARSPRYDRVPERRAHMSTPQSRPRHCSCRLARGRRLGSSTSCAAGTIIDSLPLDGLRHARRLGTTVLEAALAAVRQRRRADAGRVACSGIALDRTRPALRARNDVPRLARHAPDAGRRIALVDQPIAYDRGRSHDRTRAGCLPSLHEPVPRRGHAIAKRAAGGCAPEVATTLDQHDDDRAETTADGVAGVSDRGRLRKRNEDARPRRSPPLAARSRSCATAFRHRSADDGADAAVATAGDSFARCARVARIRRRLGSRIDHGVGDRRRTGGRTASAWRQQRSRTRHRRARSWPALWDGQRSPSATSGTAVPTGSGATQTLRSPSTIHGPSSRSTAGLMSEAEAMRRIRCTRHHSVARSGRTRRAATT